MHTANPRSIETPEAAKLIRKHLKAGFPGQKFSVKSHRHAGGSYLEVAWEDGPTAKAVEVITRTYSSGRFQSSSDCKYLAESWYCPQHYARTATTYGSDIETDNTIHQSRCCAEAELVSFEPTHVRSIRKFSPEFLQELENSIRKEEGIDAAVPSDTPLYEGHKTHITIPGATRNRARTTPR